MVLVMQYCNCHYVVLYKITIISSLIFFQFSSKVLNLITSDKQKAEELPKFNRYIFDNNVFLNYHIDYYCKNLEYFGVFYDLYHILFYM